MVEALRDLFHERHLTQAAVERLAGMPKRYLTRLFSGDVRLQFAHVYDMLEATGIEPQTFYLRLVGQGTTSDVERQLAEHAAAIRKLEAALRARPSNGGADA